MNRFRPTYSTASRVAAGLLAAILLTGCMPYRTGPTEVGVRTKKLGIFGEKGVQQQYYEPGSVHFFVPFLNDWHTFDTRLRNLDMTEISSSGSRLGMEDGMTFKTIDGNDISLDVVISYRIVPDKAPQILQHVARNDAELEDNIIRSVARSKPRDIFGELKTEEFYTADLRSAKAEEAKDVLNEILEPYGVLVERVGTRDYRFNDAYQQAIEDKKIADQQVAKNISATAAAAAEYDRKVQEAMGVVAETKARADGEYERAKIEADAYYRQQESLAQAIEAEGRAEAEAMLRMNQALSGAGGEAMVRMAIAEALQGKRIVLLPMGGGGFDVRSTNINSLLEMYGLKNLTAPAAPKPVQAN